ncbi:MAG TPA: hypothetical protein VKH43_10155 [Thermoanaerobaculia bacterium]|nr:hypothetical protein [Thermoanaerobaculia bacterium]
MLPARFPGPMIRCIRIAAACSALAFLAAPGAHAQTALRSHFDSDSIGRQPAFFDFVVLGAPGVAGWRVTAGHNPPSAPNFAAQIVPERPGDSIAAAVRRNSSYRDGTWSIAIMREGGQGGIVFRMADEKNFLVLLVDAAGGDATLAAYRNGTRQELAKGKAAIANEWGVLKIAGDGPKIAATWDGKKLLEGTDPSPAAGRSGMATAGHGITSFDEFVLDPAAEPGKR